MSCIAPEGHWILYAQGSAAGLDLNINTDASNIVTGSLGATNIFGKVDSSGACDIQFLTFLPQIPFPVEAYTGIVFDISSSVQYMTGMFSPGTLETIIDILHHRPVPPPKSWIAVKQQ